MEVPTSHQYQSPSSWRYGSSRMRHLWAEDHKHYLWRRCWLALVRAQADLGMFGGNGEELVNEVERRVAQIDLVRIAALEADLKHDVVAALRCYQEQLSTRAARTLHLGATSSDIEDNAEAMRINQSVEMIKAGVAHLRESLYVKADEMVGIPALGYTHLQPAEPISFNDRFRMWAYELELVVPHLQPVAAKGFRGAVGTDNAQVMAWMAKGNGPDEAWLLTDAVNTNACRELELWPHRLTRQIATRVEELLLFGALDALAAVLHQINQDLRLLAMLQELVRIRLPDQVGSSAMPHKVNPLKSENACALTRQIHQLIGTLWINAATQAFEHTLDESGNRRSVLPEVFILMDHVLTNTDLSILTSVANAPIIAAHLQQHGIDPIRGWLLAWFQATGADPREAHRVLSRDPDLTDPYWEGVDWEGPLAGCSILAGRGVKIDRESIVVDIDAVVQWRKQQEGNDGS